MPLELLSEQQWLMRRKLSASRVAAVYTERIGLMTLWAILTGQEQEEFPPLLGAYGLALEPVSRRWFERRSGREVAPTDPEFHYLITAAGSPLSASPDSPVTRPGVSLISPILHGTQVASTLAETVAEKTDSFAEHKTAGRMVAWKWSNGPDRYAWVQIQATFAAARAAGLDWQGAYATVLIGNGYDEERDYVVYEVEPDEDFIGEVTLWAEAFWENHVQADVPPRPDGLDATLKTLRLLFPASTKGEGRAVGVLPAEQWASPYREMKQIEQTLDQLGRRRSQIRQEIEFAMGEAGLDEAAIAATEEMPNPPRFSRLRYTAHYNAKPAQDREVSRFQELG